MIDIRDVTLDRGTRRVLESVCVTAAEGRTLGLVGPNGAGKSSLLATVYHLLTPRSGQVRIDDDDVADLTRRDIAHRISVVAQLSEPGLALPVQDSVALGLLSRRSMLQYGRTADREPVSAALTQVGLAGFEHRLTTTLSGGELQRVLIARAIVQNATHVLLDEPTNHLDIHHQYSVLHLVKTLQTTAVLVLHDLNLAAQFCDEIALLHHGRVVAVGAPFDVLTPERVSAVYGVDADVVDHDGQRHLVFRAKATPLT